MTHEIRNYNELFQAQIQVMDEVGITIDDESLVQSITVENDREVLNNMVWLQARNQCLLA